MPKTIEKLRIGNATDAARLVLEEALTANRQGTFAVGGLLIDNRSGEIIARAHNNVIKPLDDGSPYTFDPTAHGERQLVSWYFRNREMMHLPDPSEITVVTSLDPCAMCAGSLLAAGFQVGVVAMDTFAGINCAQDVAFDTLPSRLRERAAETFGYYAVGNPGGKGIYRNRMGSTLPAFMETAIDYAIARQCGSAFDLSLDAVKAKCNLSGTPPESLIDPARLPEKSGIISAFRSIYDNAYKIKLDNSQVSEGRVIEALRTTLEASENARNAVAYIDPFGNLALCLADNLMAGPAETAFMGVTQAYARLRWHLKNAFVTGASAEDPDRYLSHPKDGKFLFLYAPNPDEAQTIMTLGACGSTLEGPARAGFLQYCLPAERGEGAAELTEVIARLPPFYTQCANLSFIGFGEDSPATDFHPG